MLIIDPVRRQTQSDVTDKQDEVSYKRRAQCTGTAVQINPVDMSTSLSPVKTKSRNKRLKRQRQGNENTNNENIYEVYMTASLITVIMRCKLMLPIHQPITERERERCGRPDRETFFFSLSLCKCCCVIQLIPVALDQDSFPRRLIEAKNEFRPKLRGMTV